MVEAVTCNLNTPMPESQKCEATDLGYRERRYLSKTKPLPTQPSNQSKYDLSKTFSWQLFGNFLISDEQYNFRELF